jgi:heme oxygenase (biliverdin-IX-beta and delta-forming)
VNWSNIGFDFPARRRAHLLRADLRALGSTESSVEEIGRCTRLPAILNQDAALGCLYVQEGSRLGGVIISRELERRFGIGERSGASFFSSSGPEVGGLWKEFCSLLRQRVEGEPARHQCLEAAEETFASLEFWIREAPVHA